MAICALLTCRKKIKRPGSFGRDWCSERCYKKAEAKLRDARRARQDAKPKVYTVRRTMSDEPEVTGQPSPWRW
jgi:hypothetical protein